MAKILIIDDERGIRNSMKEILEFEKHTADVAENGMLGLEKIETTHFDLVFCDIKMEGMDGMEVLKKLHAEHSDIPVVMISGHGTIDIAVEAIKMGAYDFIAKPLDLNRILITVKNALDKTVLVQETKILKKKIENKYQMIGESAPLGDIRQMISKVSTTDARVLITGGNGTGKELVARSIHDQSNRVTGPFIEVNCAAIPTELIESELFGHEKGAFTSAIKQRKGKFEQAENGTIFLDEVGDMSLSAQAKVLRALQEHKISRVGGESDITINVRVIAATNKDLKEEIATGRFREDLYHRLSVILIKVPSLKDRKDDIPMLAQHFLKDICLEMGMQKKEIDADAVQLLQSYSWTGNIREFRNVMERLIILSDKTITLDDVKRFAQPLSQ
jgi:DNA-binding NtrC family response regulator